MKLALITPGGFGPGRKNVLPALAELASELATRHEVHVFAFGGAGPVTRHLLMGAHVHQLGNPDLVVPPGLAHRARQMFRLWRQLSHELARASSTGPFDVLHAWWASEPGQPAGIIHLASGVPLVVSIGGGELVSIPEIGYGGARSLLGRKLTDWVLGCADEVTVGTSFARSFIDNSFRQKTRVVPLGIRTGTFEASWQRSPGPPWRLLHVGSINRVKDHDTLLRAFVEVAARLQDVTLDCVGEDTLDGEVQSRARHLGLEARVTFHGFVANEQLVPLYRQAHLHVVSSRYESQSVAVLEAGAAGLPTVGTAVGLLPSLAPEAACVVPPGDPAGLAAAVCELLNDQPRREAMGQAAQNRARVHDVRFSARSFEEIYDRLSRSKTMKRPNDNARDNGPATDSTSPNRSRS